MARRKTGAGPRVDHPAVSEALVTLARSLDRRYEDGDEAPGYLDLALQVAALNEQLDDLTRLLIHYARRYEHTSWQAVADAFGVSRPTAYNRWGDPSPNDPEGGEER